MSWVGYLSPNSREYVAALHVHLNGPVKAQWPPHKAEGCRLGVLNKTATPRVPSRAVGVPKLNIPKYYIKQQCHAGSFFNFGS
jgi:hypothetical protein